MTMTMMTKLGMFLQKYNKNEWGSFFSYLQKYFYDFFTSNKNGEYR